MTNKIIEKLIRKEVITDEDLEDMLYEICDREHSSCNNDWPIYKKVLTKKVKEDRSCPFHRKGRMMLEALREHNRIVKS